MPETKQKRKAGQPKKVLADYLTGNWQQTVFEMSAEGCSDVEIRAAFCWDGKSFNHSAWDALLERDEEFLATIKKAKVLCQAWWENQGRTGIRGKDFQTGLWTMNMKNRFGWKDKIEQDLNINANFSEMIRKVNNRMAQVAN